MVSIQQDQRIDLAEKLRSLKQSIAVHVTDEFFRNHPDWLQRYGEKGRRHGIDDACFHVDFLAGAIECDSTAPFEDYARWTVRMLQARGIAAHFVAENLRQIERALHPHLAPVEQATVVRYLQAGGAACIAGSENQPGNPDGELALTRRLFLQALLQGHRQAACTIALEALKQGRSLVQVYVEILQEALYEVGRLWESNRISVADEHMATAIAQLVLARLYSHIEISDVSRGKAVVTGVAGELHQVGANMVADFLEVEGWNVRFLGTNMPHEGILHAVEEHQAEVVGISCTMLFSIPRVRQLIQDIRRQVAGRALRILVGGGAFRPAPSLADEIGADGCAADLRGLRNLLPA